MKNKTIKTLIKKDLLEFISSTEGYISILKQCIEAIKSFVDRYPDDKDVEIFVQELRKLQDELIH